MLFTGGWCRHAGGRTARQERGAEGATRAVVAGVGRGNNVGGGGTTWQECTMSSGWRDKIGRGEEEVAAMTTVAISSRGQRAADNATR